MDYLYAICGTAVVWFLCSLVLAVHRPARKPGVFKEKNLFTMVQPALYLLVPVTRWMMWKGYRQWARRRLDAAGLWDAVDVEEFFASRFMLAGLAWVATLAFADGLRFLLVALAFGFPEFWILSIIQARHAEIRRTMPYFVDLLSLCTGAGLDLGSAIDRVVAKAEEGPLFEEFKQSRRDVSLGMSQADSMGSLARRVQMPELTSFVAIIVQAIKMGASVSSILDAQAEKMRLERYEKAERIGTQAQQKILVPLLLLILPAFILLGIVPIIVEMLRPIMAGGLMGGL